MFGIRGNLAIHLSCFPVLASLLNLGRETFGHLDLCSFYHSGKGLGHVYCGVGGGSVGCFQTHSRRWQLDCVEHPPCGRAHCPHRKQEEVMGAPFWTLLPRNLSRPWSPRIYCTRWHRGLSVVIFMMRSAQRLAAWRRAGKYLHINIWPWWGWKEVGNSE